MEARLPSICPLRIAASFRILVLIKAKTTNRFLVAAMLVESVLAAGCESDEAKSWRELKETRAAKAKAKAAEVPASKDPDCIRQNDARLQGEIGQEGMTELAAPHSAGLSLPWAAPDAFLLPLPTPQLPTRRAAAARRLLAWRHPHPLRRPETAGNVSGLEVDIIRRVPKGHDQHHCE